MELLQNAFKEDKFEELFVANWTQFIDSSKLMAYVLQQVQKNTNNLAIISNTEIKHTGMKITLSRCNLTQYGLLFWIEFIVPLAATKTAEGTMELHLSPNNIISFNYLLGNIYSAN